MEEQKKDAKKAKQELSVREIGRERVVQPGSLDEFFSKLIAEREGINPEDVTVEYIREQRQLRFYPTTRYQTGTKYGGYNRTGLIFYTRQELAAIARRVDEAFEKLEEV